MEWTSQGIERVNPSHRTIRFACSSCTGPIEVHRRQVGTKVRCPWCYTMLAVPSESRGPGEVETYELADGTEAGARAARPAVSFSCSVCGTRLDATEEEVGQRMVCPDCGTACVVPAPSSATSPSSQSGPLLPPVEIYGVAEGLGQPPPSDQEVYRRYVPVVCLVCHTRMHATEDQVGQTLVCPDCGTANPVLAPVPAPSPFGPAESQEGYALAESSGPASPRPDQKEFVYKCPVCRTRFYARREEVGRSTRCPDCGTQFAIPPPPSDQIPVEPSQEPAEVYAVEGEPGPVRGEEPVAVSARPREGEAASSKPAATLREVLQERIAYHPPSPRAELPSWPFVQGVWAFPWYPTSRGCWLGLSAGAVLWWTLGLELYALSAKERGTAQFLTAVLLGVFAVTSLILFVWLALILLRILSETANGSDRIEQWTSGDVFDRVFDGTYLVNSAVLCGLIAWAIERWLPQIPFLIGLACTSFVLFPVLLLAMLETGSPFNPVSLHIWGSLFWAGWGWIRFYLLSGAMLAGLAALGFALFRLIGTAAGYLLAPWTTAAAMIYFRLLGRLGWYCTEQARRSAAAC